jgi:hypothetical protein
MLSNLLPLKATNPMPAFLRIGNKFIAPAHILGVAIGADYTMQNGSEVRRTKVTVAFTGNTEIFVGAEAEALLAFLSHYTEIIDAVPA